MKNLCPICRKAPPAGETLCPTHGLYALSPKALEELSTAPLLGLVLNQRYALVGFIGGGGMGAVYLGLDIRLGREVAIKVLKQAISADPSDRKRFEVEARALSKLRSVNTVTIHDFGVVEQGVATPLAFMVMECVEGHDLGARIDRGPIAPAVVVDIVQQMGLSLDEAHGVDIIHRDIKPGNVLLTHTPAGAMLVKVVDFGIARMDGESATATGSILGTPQYMAPEQCVASATLDGRVDVYQTAVMTYEMLTGRRPFVAQNSIKILSMHIGTTPPPLAGADAAPVWRRLEAVVHRGMAKSVEDRYPTVGAFGQALAGVLEVVDDVSPLPATKILAPIAEPAAPKKRPLVWVGLLGVLALAAAAYLLFSPSVNAPSAMDAGPQPIEEKARVVGASPPDAGLRVPADAMPKGAEPPVSVVVDAATPVVVDAAPPQKPHCGDRKCQKNRGENCRTCRVDCRCRRDYVCPKKGRLNPENRGCVPDLSNLGF